MWIFGKKSKPPTTVPAADLPPELRPFYGRQNITSLQTRRLLALLGLVIIIAAAVLLGIWLHANFSSVNTPSSQTSTQTTTPNHNSTQTTTKPSTAKSNPAQPSQISKAPTNTTTTPTTIPNTGPGTAMLLIAGISSVGGAVIYHLHQMRTAQNKR